MWFVKSSFIYFINNLNKNLNDTYINDYKNCNLIFDIFNFNNWSIFKNIKYK